MITRLVGTTAALVLLGPAIAFSADRTPHLRDALHNHQFSALKGMTVENNDGERLGTLVDFVLDMQSGRVEFGIIKSSGFGPFAKQKLVPSFCLSLSSVKQHTLALEVNDTRWSKAPAFDAKNLKDLANPARKSQIAEFYHFVGDIGEKERYSVHTLNPTGPQSRQTDKAALLVLASDLIGCEVLTSSRQPMGKISDLLLDSAQRKDNFAIFSSGGFLKPGTSYAVPLADLQKTDHKTQLRLPGDVDPAGAPLFDWSHAPQPGIYRYDLKHP